MVSSTLTILDLFGKILVHLHLETHEDSTADLPVDNMSRDLQRKQRKQN